MKTQCASVILQVSELDAAIRFYVDSLEFTEEFRYGQPAYYGGVKHGEVFFHIATGKDNSDRIGMGSVYVFSEDIDAYYERLVGRGVQVTSKLNTWGYGMRDFQIADPDGNRICFGARAEK